VREERKKTSVRSWCVLHFT